MESNDNNQVTTATENAQRNLDQDSLLQNGLTWRNFMFSRLRSTLSFPNSQCKEKKYSINQQISNSELVIPFGTDRSIELPNCRSQQI